MGLFGGSRRFVRQLLKQVAELAGLLEKHAGRADRQQSAYRVELEAVAKNSEELSSNIMSSALVFGVSLQWSVYFKSEIVGGETDWGFRSKQQLAAFLAFLNAAQALAVVSLCIFTASFNATKALTAQMLADSDVEVWEIAALRGFRRRIQRLQSFGRGAFWAALLLFLLASLLYKWVKVADGGGTAKVAAVAVSVAMLAATLAFAGVIRAAQVRCRKQLGSEAAGEVGEPSEGQEMEQQRMRAELEAIDTESDEFSNNAVLSALLYSFVLTWVMDHDPMAFERPDPHPRMHACFFLFITSAECLFSFCLVVFTLSFNITKDACCRALLDAELSRAEVDAVRRMLAAARVPQAAARAALPLGLVLFNAAAVVYLLVKVPHRPEYAVPRTVGVAAIAVGTAAFVAVQVAATRAFARSQRRIRECAADGTVSEEDYELQYHLRMELESVNKRSEEFTSNAFTACLILGFASTWMVDYSPGLFDGHTAGQTTFLVALVYAQASATFAMVVFLTTSNVSKRLGAEMCADSVIETGEMRELRQFLAGRHRVFRMVGACAFWSSLVVFISLTVVYMWVKIDPLDHPASQGVAYGIVPTTSSLLLTILVVISRASLQARREMAPQSGAESPRNDTPLVRSQLEPVSDAAMQATRMTEIEAYEKRSEEWAVNAVSSAFVVGFTFTWLMNYDTGLFKGNESAHTLFTAFILSTQGIAAVSMIVFTYSRNLIVSHTGRITADATITETEIAALRSYTAQLDMYHIPARRCFCTSVVLFLASAMTYVCVKVQSAQTVPLAVAVTALSCGFLLMMCAIRKVSKELKSASKRLRRASGQGEVEARQGFAVLAWLGFTRTKPPPVQNQVHVIPREIRTELDAVELHAEEWGMNGVSSAMVFGFSTLWVLDYDTVFFDNDAGMHAVYMLTVTIAISLSACTMVHFTLTQNAVKTLLCEIMVDAAVEEEEMAVLREFVGSVSKEQNLSRAAFWVSLLSLVAAGVFYGAVRAPDGADWLGMIGGLMIGFGLAGSAVAVLFIARNYITAVDQMVRGDELAGKVARRVAEGLVGDSSSSVPAMRSPLEADGELVPAAAGRRRLAVRLGES